MSFELRAQLQIDNRSSGSSPVDLTHASTPSRMVALAPRPRDDGTSPRITQEKENFRARDSLKNFRAASFNYARRPMLAPARDRDKVVKTQGHTQAIEAGTQIGSAGRNLNSDFFHHPKGLNARNCSGSNARLTV